MQFQIGASQGIRPLPEGRFARHNQAEVVASETFGELLHEEAEVLVQAEVHVFLFGTAEQVRLGFGRHDRIFQQEQVAGRSLP